MTAIIKSIHALFGANSLANSYVPDSFDAHSQAPWLPWVAMVRGITLVSFGAGTLRDGWMRYDQPGSMHPMQHSDVSFVAAGGVSDYEYLRRHCDRLLIITQDPVEVFLPPGLQRRLRDAGRRGPYRISPPDAAVMESLWLRRNNCPEQELDAIDDRMLKLVAPDLPPEEREYWV